MRRRIAPFLDLLDARYLPLLFVATPQAYTVYAWLLADGAPAIVAILGGLGFEFVYVGAIAWAARGAGWGAARIPAVTALLFSVAVAVAHYGAGRGALAVLHAGFPLVGYAYMVMMHAPGAHPDTRPAQVRRERRRLVRRLAQTLRAERAGHAAALAELRTARDLAAQEARRAAQAHEVARAAEAQAAQAQGVDARTVAQWLAASDVSGREIARRLGVGESTVRSWLKAPARPTSAAD